MAHLNCFGGEVMLMWCHNPVQKIYIYIIVYCRILIQIAKHSVPKFLKKCRR